LRLGHWDAQFGLSGDMALGSLLDAGARLEAVNAALAVLGVPGLRAETRRVQRCSLACAAVRIRWEGDGAGQEHPAAGHAHPHAHPEHAHPHTEHAPAAVEQVHVPHTQRAYGDIRALLQRAALDAEVRERALAVFARLAEAEGRVHGRPAEEVHFHEVGGQDAIGDVVGTAAALVDLGIAELTVSPLPAGGGTVSSAHGLLPVPAPAVAVLLAGFELRPGPVAAELVTPTGAALAAALARPAAAWPALRLAGSGWGAGSRDFPDHPNACRFVWGEDRAGPGLLQESLVEIETNIDDQSPEAVAYLYERLFAAGALDVTTSPLGMKKQRAGIRLWALARPDQAEALTRLVFLESAAIGLRVREVRRLSLPRAVETVSTPYGPVRIKVARLDGHPVNAAPEFEDCRAAAAERGVPLKAVLAAALAAWEAGRTP